jgi:hypothetical protein
MIEWYRRDGTPYTFRGPSLGAGWVEMMREVERDLTDINLKRVAQTFLPNGVEVSTVWLGLDHRYTARGRPLIFETMLFVKQRSSYEFRGRKRAWDRTPIGEQWRYTTEEEALRGHKMLVKKWRKFKSADDVLTGLGSSGASISSSQEPTNP